MQYRVEEFEETKRRAADTTAKSVSIHSQEKKSGNENRKNDNCKYLRQIEANKSTKGNASKQKKNASKQTELSATDTVNSSYLKNIPLMSTPLGKYPSKQLVMDQSVHTNRSGVEKSCCRL